MLYSLAEWKKRICHNSNFSFVRVSIIYNAGKVTLPHQFSSYVTKNKRNYIGWENEMIMYDELLCSSLYSPVIYAHTRNICSVWFSFFPWKSFFTADNKKNYSSLFMLYISLSEPCFRVTEFYSTEMCGIRQRIDNWIDGGNAMNFPFIFRCFFLYPDRFFSY